MEPEVEWERARVDPQMVVINSEAPKCTLLMSVHSISVEFLVTLTVFSDCDVGLFELALQLREKRLDIEEALVEEKKIIDNLKKEHDTLSKKVWRCAYLFILSRRARRSPPATVLLFHSRDSS